MEIECGLIECDYTYSLIASLHAIVKSFFFVEIFYHVKSQSERRVCRRFGRE